MSEMMGYCGIRCDECPVYKATVANDMEMREKTAEEWNSEFGMNLKPENINCLGCKSDLLFSHCNVCEIRPCAQEKGNEDCGKCEFFSCDKLESMLKENEEARERLIKGRNNN